MKKNFLNKDLCSICDGECCKNMPGCNLPEDFGKSLYFSLLEHFKTGKWAIDWWEGDPRKGKHELTRAFFIRPAIKNKTNLFDPSWGGECVFFTSGVGCSLDDKKRPAECRLLEPNSDRCIKHGGSKQEASIAWIPFHDVIIKAAKDSGKYE